MIHPWTETAVVVPTCRGYTVPSQSIPLTWIIVHDQELHDVKIVADRLAPYPRIEHIIAPDRRLYGEKTSAIRQAGLDYAYNRRFKYVLTLDDDCEIPRDWALRHKEALSGFVPVASATVPGQVIRGFPAALHQPVAISHGLWSGVLDYPAWYQIAASPGPVEIQDKGWKKISAPFPMCGMNVGFRREALPAVYFQHRFVRHDDIFAGWFAQHVLALEGYGFVNGGAVVQHDRASNPEVNLEKERPGDKVNAWLVKAIRRANIRPTGDPARTLANLRIAVNRDAMNSGFMELSAMLWDMQEWAKQKEKM